MNPSLERRIRQRIQGPEQSFRAICHLGFESVLAQELLWYGIEKVQLDTGAVEFTAKYNHVCAIQGYLRTASRLLMRIHQWHAENFGQLEKGLHAIAWELYLPPQSELTIDVTCRQSRLYHSDAVAERAQKVITPILSAHSTLPLPAIAQRIFLRLNQDQCSASIDLSGTLLYKRGYNRYTEDAPLRETMAAAILLSVSFWENHVLYDPMAGSGVFSLEACQWIHGPLPGQMRPFACQSQPAFKDKAYAYAMAHHTAPFSANDLAMVCSDIDPKACATIQHNIQAAQVHSWVQPTCSDFFQIKPQSSHGLLVLNPPYGKRLHTNPVALYREIGKKIRLDFPQFHYAIISPAPACRQALQLQPNKVIQSQNGGLPIQVLCYTSKK